MNDDVWLEQGATDADYEHCLRALSLQDKGPAPLLAVASDSNPPHLLIASRALFCVFNVDSGEQLSRRLLDGDDPGARRFATLCRNLALEGAPRLERLRFFIGPGTEMITFLCRRVPTQNRPLFIAAALGLQSGSKSEGTVRPNEAEPPATLSADVPKSDMSPNERLDDISSSMSAPGPADEARMGPAPPMGVQAIQATLRARWPSNRKVRFLWQSDADFVCTRITPPLADVVGANADIVGHDLMSLAPQIDPTGRLADALATRQTWSGLDVNWPIADAPAAVAVALGAVPAVDRDKEFGGYRGYGVINLDRLETGAPQRLAMSADRTSERATPASENVVRFPSKSLSPEDQQVFTAIGAELREDAGLAKAGLLPLDPVKRVVAQDIAEEKAIPAAETHIVPATAHRTGEIARNGLAVLDRLAIGLLVSRDNVPIFANRHLLDCLGFADEDELHAAGGMTHLFGGQPGNVTGSAAIGIRARDGRITAANARMQTIEWDGLPATLLTLLPTTSQKPDPIVDARPSPSGDRQVDDDEVRELREILETATDGVATIDADGNVLSLNRSGEALFSCDRSAVIGKPFLSLFAAHNQSLVADYLDGLKSNATQSLLNDGREFLVNLYPDGSIPVFMTLGRLTPLQNEASDERPRFCALFRDLTHWKKVERDLESAKQDAERANALKTDFLAKVSHEVRTPLNAIIGFAEVMMEERLGPIGNERYKDYLRDIHGSGTHVVSLVNDLLDLSKIEAGKIELAAEPIDANKVIGECVSLMQPQASHERVIMRLSLAAALPQIRADERSLRQIVLNILSNAIKFNEPGGQVIVATAKTERGHVVIRIRDTGTGMSDSDVAAALEPFRQLATARPSSGGTGLGLPLTKALVEANQASFSIRSKLGQGTLVEVAFPSARVLAG